MKPAEGAPERLFVGVPLPSSLRPSVERVQKGLPRLQGLRVLRPEQLHITLAFIGQVPASLREAAREVVAGVPAQMGGEVTTKGLVFLPSPRKARVVAVGVADPAGLLTALFEGVMAGLEERGVMRREKRPFLPHVTIARLREPASMQPTSEGVGEPFPVDSVCLYQSELRREGARYTVIERRVLVGADGPTSGC